MFVAASATVAILTGESSAALLIRVLGSADDPITSPLAVFEALMASSRKLAQDVASSQAQLDRFLKTANVRIVPITADDGKQSTVAHDRYGKGRGHPAQLNMGDCFAYACARTHDVPLLYVGNDFTQTDIRSATA